MYNKELEKKIDVFTEEHKKEMMEDIFSLVRVRSVSEDGKDGYPFGKGCHDVLETVTGITARYGFETHNFDEHCGYVVYGNNGGKKIGMFAHLDVVPEGTGWYHEPYEPVYEKGFLIGRGVADNKGSAMTSLYALRFLKENGIKLNHDVLLYFGLSEETGMADLRYFVEHGPVPYFSLVPDSNFPVCYGEKGIMRYSYTFDVKEPHLKSLQAGLVINSIPAEAVAVFNVLSPELVEKLSSCDGIKVEGNTVRSTGKACHAAFPEGSVNAINVLMNALIATGAVKDPVFETVKALTGVTDGSAQGIAMEDKESGALTCSGTLLDMHDGSLKLSFDVRYPVTKKGDDIQNILKSYADEHGAGFVLNEDSHPAYTPIDSPEVQTLCKIADYVHGRHLEPYTMGGGTYSRELPFAVGFGPGLPDAPNLYEGGRGNGHQPDECISFDLLLKGFKAMVLALVELDKIIS